MSNICINCIHKDVCYKYRLNYVSAREGSCNDYLNPDLSKYSDNLWKQASIPYTYNAPQHDWKCGYPKMCEECHSDSYYNGFDAGYEEGYEAFKKYARSHISELNERIHRSRCELETPIPKFVEDKTYKEDPTNE